MEHSIGTPTNATPHAPLDPPPAATQARAERQARADWLITELSRLAAQAEDPNDRVRFRRTADSLTRLATAFRP
ncbi:hypothetical protein [Kribbella sp. C-35]|uniref:hypothetical protein n=1 Tax=Kribbella sp. C-35 TaxID=2789276 RepID=UPI00397BB026